MAGVLAESMPADGRLLRYGGDEFVVLLPGTGDAEARHGAETLVAAVNDYPWSLVAAGLQVRVTTGCSALWALSGRRPAADAARLFRRADEALLDAKHLARRGAAAPDRAGPVTEVLDLRDLSLSAERGGPPADSPCPAEPMERSAGGRRSRRQAELIDLTEDSVEPARPDRIGSDRRP